MLTLYYCPGACSMASHITIEETGARFESKPLRLSKGEHQTPDYLKINPRARVPALSVDGKVITENVAILTYLARQFPEAQLLPADPYEEAVCLSAVTWFSNAVHPPFTHINRPERFAVDPNAYATVKEAGRKGFWTALREIDSMLAGKEWMAGAQFTICDPYALVFYGWGARIELPMAQLTAYTAFKERMLKRPAVRRVLEREQSPLLGAA